MAGKPMKAGFAVSGFDPKTAARQRFKAADGQVKTDVAVRGTRVDVVIASRPSAAALRETGVPAPLFSATVPVDDAAMGMGQAQDNTAAGFDVLDRMSSPPAVAVAVAAAVAAAGKASPGAKHRQTGAAKGATGKRPAAPRRRRT